MRRLGGLASFLIAWIRAVDAQQTIDIMNAGVVIAALKAAMPPLQSYFQGNNAGNGAWVEMNGAKHQIQWHESGQFQDFFYTYAKLTGDTTYISFVDANVQLALGQYKNYVAFLDNNSAYGGRWNDDIGWWGLALVTATEYNPNGAIAGTQYLEIATATHAEMYESWDNGCNGGIFWSRDRNAPKENDRTYKASISNAQLLELGARLFILTGDPNYKQVSDQAYAWLKQPSVMINQATYEITDGINNQDCSPSDYQFSYTTAECVLGLSYLYKATNTKSYIDEAHLHFAHIVKDFSRNNVLFDWECDGGGCKDPSGFLWPVYRSLAVLYTVTPDPGVQSEIKILMKASADVVFKNCDANWNCIRHMDPSDPNVDYVLPDGSNIRDQFETVALLQGLAVISTFQPPAPPSPAPSSSPPPAPSTTISSFPPIKSTAAIPPNSSSASSAAVDSAPPAPSNAGLIAGVVIALLLLAGQQSMGDKRDGRFADKNNGKFPPPVNRPRRSSSLARTASYARSEDIAPVLPSTKRNNAPAREEGARNGARAGRSGAVILGSQNQERSHRFERGENAAFTSARRNKLTEVSPSPERRPTRRTTDSSPPVRPVYRRNTDSSPPVRRRNTDSSPPAPRPVYRADKPSLSPARQPHHRNTDSSPPSGRRRHDADDMSPSPERSRVRRNSDSPSPPATPRGHQQRRELSTAAIRSRNASNSRARAPVASFDNDLVPTPVKPSPVPRGVSSRGQEPGNGKREAGPRDRSKSRPRGEESRGVEARPARASSPMQRDQRDPTIDRTRGMSREGAGRNEGREMRRGASEARNGERVQGGSSSPRDGRHDGDSRRSGKDRDVGRGDGRSRSRGRRES
ncbi:glycosyl hydrolase family 76-domain-containing protein [Chytriomyces sp. MP71]|nr:glycosyl hydrolase family 76-domain-containing protein [Chytriomyces sp. MP71]